MLGAFTVAYVGALHIRLVGFGLASAVFLFLIIAALNRFDKKRLVKAAVLGVVLGFGCEFLFTQVFVVDLPASG